MSKISKEKINILKIKLNSKNKEIKKLKEENLNLRKEFPREFQNKTELEKWKQDWRNKFKQILKKYNLEINTNSDDELYNIIDLIISKFSKIELKLKEIYNNIGKLFKE